MRIECDAHRGKPLNQGIHPRRSRQRFPKLICTDEVPAPSAFAHRIRKSPHVPARFPHLRIHNDRAIDPDHRDFLTVGPWTRVAHHVVPPGVLDVLFQLDAERAVVPEAADAAVNLARLEDEAAALAERDQLFHFNGHGGTSVEREAACGALRALNGKPMLLFYFCQRLLTMPTAPTSSRSGSRRSSGTSAKRSTSAAAAASAW